MADDARLAIVLEANIDKLNAKLDAATAKVHGYAKSAQKDLDETGSAFDKFVGKTNIGEAFENIFSKSRLAVFEEGAAKIPIFGSAIEALGPAGLIASAGLAALAIAGEHVRESLEWAEGLERQAHALGLSTTQLQAFDEAAIATGVGLDASRAALTSFSEAFGRYASGQATGKTAKFFDALGFTPQSARDITDIGAAAVQTLSKIAALPNAANRASEAAGTGLQGFLPLLNEGEEGIEKLKRAYSDAIAAGPVGPEQLAKATELNDQIETLQHRIGVELKSAFLDLGPAILQVTKWAADAVADIAAIPAALRGFHRLREGDTVPVGYKPTGNFTKDLVALGNAPDAAELAGKLAGGDFKGFQDAIGYTPRPAAARDLSIAKADPNAARKAEEARKATDDAIATAQKALLAQQKDALTIQSSLTGDLEERADLEAQAVDAARAESDSEVKKRELDIAHREALGQVVAGTTAQVRAIDAQAEVQGLVNDAQKKLHIQVEGQIAARQKDLDAQAVADGFARQMIDIYAGLARTAEERRQLELRNLAADKRAADERAQAQHDADLSRATTPEQRAKLERQFSNQQSARNDLYTAQRSQVLQATADPLVRWATEAPRTAQEIGEAVQTYAVKAFDQLNSGMADAIVNGKSLTDVLATGFRDAEAALISYLLKQAEIGVLNAVFPGFGTAVAAIGHHATGANSFGGGLTQLNELGPEGVAYLPRGTQIIPNDVLRSLANGVPRIGGAPSVTNLTVSVDASGAFSFEHVRQAVAQGVTQAVQTSRAVIPRDLADRARYRLPG